MLLCLSFGYYNTWNFYIKFSNKTIFCKTTLKYLYIKLLQNFLARTESTINEAFEVDGPCFMTTLALIIMKPNDWEKNRQIFLQKLLLTAHIRSVNTPNDRSK